MTEQEEDYRDSLIGIVVDILNHPDADIAGDIRAAWEDRETPIPIYKSRVDFKTEFIDGIKEMFQDDPELTPEKILHDLQNLKISDLGIYPKPPCNFWQTGL